MSDENVVYYDPDELSDEDLEFIEAWNGLRTAMLGGLEVAKANMQRDYLSANEN